LNIITIYTLLKQAIKAELIEKDRQNSNKKKKKIQTQPRNLGNNSPPSRNPNGSYKKLKAFDRRKTASN
jgi:hypothetical protein